MKRHTAGVIALTVFALPLAGMIAMHAHVKPARLATPSVVIGEGKDRYPSQTAEDWATYADYVVVVSAIKETQLEPRASEVERGEGLVGRLVNLRVDQIVWSNPSTAVSPPKSFAWQGSGWLFHDGHPDQLTRFAIEDRPRVEVGHSYIIAIIWQPAKCSLGDSPEAAQWVGLGEGSTIPYDDQIVGNGEFEGSRVIQGAVSTASQTAPSENVKIEDMMAGRAGRDVAAVLKTATPQGRDSRLVPSAECG